MIPNPPTNQKTTNTWRCALSKDGNSFTHYLVVDERILGEACVVEKVSGFISLALVKLALSGPKTSTCFAFVENQALVPKILN